MAYQAAVVALAASAVLGWYVLQRRVWGAQVPVAGALVALAVLGVVCAAVAPGRGPVGVSVRGARANTWPGEIRFRDLPEEGVKITLRTPGASSVRVTAIDETHGLPEAATPRPAGVVASTREDGDLVAVARTYQG